MSEAKIFKRFILRYLLVGFLVVLGSIPFAFIAYKHIRDYTITNNISKMESGILQLENNIEKMNMISSMISDDQNLILLKKSEGEIFRDKVLNLKLLSNQMFDIRYLYDFSPMFFVLFYNNDAFVSTNQVSDNFPQYYGKFLKVDDMSSGEFKDILFDRERKSPFIHVNELKYHVANKEVTTKDAVLFIKPIEVDETVNTNKAVMVFVIEPDTLAEMLLSKESLDEGVVQITDASDNVMINYGKNASVVHKKEGNTFINNQNEPLKLMQYVSSKKGLNITVGFPMTQINMQMRSILQVLLIYAGVGLFVALIFTVAFSIHWFVPIRNMIKEAYRLESSKEGKKNEFDYVRESLLHLVSAKNELETKILLANAQKQAIELENIFIKGFYKKEDENRFVERYPFVLEGYYVAYLEIKSSNETGSNQEALIFAMELLKRDLLKETLHVRSMTNTEILLIPATKDINDDMLKKTLISMQEVIGKEFQVLCFIGLSPKESEISNINVAYSLARQTVLVYKNMNTSFVRFYQYISDSDKGFFHMGFLNKLYELILCSGKEQIKSMFEEAREECNQHQERYEFHKEEIYHAISFVYYAANKQLAFIPKQEIKMQKYQQNHSLKQCLDLLEKSIYRICDKIEENKKSKNVELRDKIILYLEQNYRRVNLTVDIVSKEVGISDKYLSTFLKEHVGKTFSVYLDELRIGYSKECLKNTDWSNDKIAQEAGFGAVNSFYRVFKKYIGVSPSVYKKSVLELEK